MFWNSQLNMFVESEKIYALNSCLVDKFIEISIIIDKRPCHLNEASVNMRTKSISSQKSSGQY